MVRVDICLPVKNEQAILKKNTLVLLEYLSQANLDFICQVVILTNGVSDDSMAIAKELASRNQSVKHFDITQPGRGHALKTYFSQSQADILAYMDIDLAVSLQHLPELIYPIINHQADLVIGSRLLADSSIKRSINREFTSQSYNLLSRLILGNKISDLQCGFKAISKTAFDNIAFKLHDQKWFFDTEMVIHALKSGFHVKEIPVNWEENRYDQRKSKVKIMRDSLTFFVNLIRLRMNLGKK